MDCREASELMAGAVLGDLSGPEARALEQHLSECLSCREDFPGWQQALEAASGYARRETPEAVARRVLAPARAELAAMGTRRRKGRLVRLALVPASAAAALLFAVFVLWSTRPPVVAPPPSGADQSHPVVSVPQSQCRCWRFIEGDAGNSRRAESAALGALDQVLWKRAVEGVPGAYKPLAWKDLVIIGRGPARRTVRGGGGLAAFHAGTGDLAWRRAFEAGDFYKAKGFPDRCILNGQLFVTDGTACLVLEATTGRDLARFDPPAGVEGWGFLTASDDRLYGASREGRTLFCLDAATGSAVWSRPLDGAVFVPALSGGLLYVHTDTGTLAALDARDGREVWRLEDTGVTGRATVHVRGQPVEARRAGAWVVVVSERDEVVACSAAAPGRDFAAEGGGATVAWRRSVPGAFASGLALGDTAVYTVGGAAALALADGRVLWQPAAWTDGFCSPPTVAGGRVVAIGGDEEASLRLLGPSGQSYAEVSGLAQQACDGAIVAAGRIYVVAAGHLVAIPCGST